jgi:uncharacterized protein (TIGR00730 family)
VLKTLPCSRRGAKPPGTVARSNGRDRTVSLTRLGPAEVFVAPPALVRLMKGALRAIHQPVRFSSGLARNIGPASRRWAVRERLCVFCGSRSGARPRYLEQARVFGREIASRGVGLVYGGGGKGIMGAVADGCLEGGGEVIGVIPRDLFGVEHLHMDLSEVVETSGMHERKLRMTELCTAFAVLPGGYGTLDETFEAITWQQLRIHDKPIGFLDVGGFFAPLLALLAYLEKEGFIDVSCPRPHVRAEAGALIDDLLALARFAKEAPVALTRP